MCYSGRWKNLNNHFVNIIKFAYTCTERCKQKNSQDFCLNQTQAARRLLMAEPIMTVVYSYLVNCQYEN